MRSQQRGGRVEPQVIVSSYSNHHTIVSHVVISSHHLIITSSCHHIIVSSCHGTVISSYLHIIIPSQHLLRHAPSNARLNLSHVVSNISHMVHDVIHMYIHTCGTYVFVTSCKPTPWDPGEQHQAARLRYYNHEKDAKTRSREKQLFVQANAVRSIHLTAILGNSTRLRACDTTSMKKMQKQDRERSNFLCKPTPRDPYTSQLSWGTAPGCAFAILQVWKKYTQIER